VRTRTILAGLVACLLTLTLTGAPPAHAAPKPAREVGGKIVNVTQQKRTCKSCIWRVVKRERTDRNTRYRFRVGAPREGRWYYRVAVPETKKYRKSFSDVYYTFRF